MTNTNPVLFKTVTLICGCIIKMELYKWNDWISVLNTVNTFSKAMNIHNANAPRNCVQCGLDGSFTVLWPSIYNLLGKNIIQTMGKFLEEIPVKIVGSWAKIQTEYKPTMSPLCKPAQLCSGKLSEVSWQKLNPGISRCKLRTVTNTPRSSVNTVLCICYVIAML